MAITPQRPLVTNQNVVWDVNTLAWVRMTQPLISTDTLNIALPNEGQQTMANSISVAIASNQSALDALQNLSVPKHDYISLSYTGSNLTGVVFKTGGSGGSTVATLTLAYTGSNLTSVTKT